MSNAILSNASDTTHAPGDKALLHKTGKAGSAPPASPQDDSHSMLQKVINSLTEFSTLSKIMRVMGALTVVAAMSAFLLQDWAIGNDVHRFYLLLAQTLLLGLSGLGLSYLLKETKGARVFFCLSILSITANMTTLGALIFSVVQWSGSLSNYPELAFWQSTDYTAIGLAAISAFAVAIPMSLFNNMVLVRKLAIPFTALLLLNNTLLLLPVRDPLSISLLAIFGTVIPLYFLRKHLRNNVCLQTLEGRFALASIFLPMAILLIRSCWLYQADSFLYTALGLITFSGLHISAQSLQQDAISKRLLDWLSLIAAMFIAIPAAQLVSAISILDIGIVALGAIFAAFTLQVAKQGGRNRASFIAIAGLVLSLSNLLQLFVVGGLISAVFCLLAGIATFMLAKLAGKKWLFKLGGGTAAIGFIYQNIQVFGNIDFSNWITLSLIGLLTIIAASVLERYGALLKIKWQKWTRTETD